MTAASGGIFRAGCSTHRSRDQVPGGATGSRPTALGAAVVSRRYSRGTKPPILQGPGKVSMKRIVLVVMMLVVTGCGSRSTPSSSAARADSLPPPGVTAVDDSVLHTESTAAAVETAALAPDQPGCDGGRVTFEYPPVDLERIE